MKDEDYAYGQWKQAKIERDWDSLTNKVDFAKFDAMERGIPIHQKVGTMIPFSRTVDRDPNPRIPLSVPSEVPSGKWIWVYIVLAVCLFVAAQWKW